MSQRQQVDTNLNLVPIMNLVTILIPFLLMSAQFVSLAVLDTALPAVTKEFVGPPPEEGLKLSLFITQNGYEIAGSGKALGVPTNDNGRVSIPCIKNDCGTDASYDHKALTAMMAEIKEVHPDHQEVLLVPGSNTSYGTLIRAMDASRSVNGKDLFPGAVIVGGAT